MVASSGVSVWPELPWPAWRDTCSTLQLWTQVVGKVRLKLAPKLNHTWHVTLYVTCRGLTTSPMPYGERMVQIDFDFLDHLLVLQSSDGMREVIPLKAMSVAAFYGEVMQRLESLGVAVHLYTTPLEVADPIPFEKDETHHSYDAEYAQRFWHALVQADRVFGEFRARFIGKVSPIHFFWGAMDLAVTRFSGRVAPVHPPTPGLPDRVVRDAYSHEVSSAGFWPGAEGIEAMFYSYAYPQPGGYDAAAVRPGAASFNKAMGEFVLPYEAVRTAANPDAMLLDFLQSTYEAAANLGKWDRQALEAG
jgi:hypothetical protein